MNTKPILALLFATAVLHGTAKVQLPAYLTDNMVVQQNSVLTVKGNAKPGADVRLDAEWLKKGLKTKAASDGSFTISLPTPAAGGPYAIIVDDGDGKAILENVLSGEVWLCSGQSNMEFPIHGWIDVMNSGEVIATSQHPDVRLLQVRKRMAFTPQNDVETNMGGWVISSPASMDFSAIAYFFATRMAEELKVPVGVIDATWGGTPAEAWTSTDALSNVPGFENEVAALKTFGTSREAMQENYRKVMEEWLSHAKAPEASFNKAILQQNWPIMTAPGYFDVTTKPGFDGIFWIQKSIDIPASLAGQELTLNLGPIDDEDETYFNGTLIAKGSGFSTPRRYTVPAELVKAGPAVISIRVTDNGGEGGFAAKPGEMYATAADGTKISLEGDWHYDIALDFSTLPPKPTDINSSGYPSVLYNAMLEPLASMPVKGVLWYQGCTNVGRAEQYEPLFKALINNWRELWQQPDMPFYFVQLAGWLKPENCQPDSEWAALRHSQAKALELPNTGMAVAIDLGNPADIHPTNKQEVSRRLEELALKNTYGRADAVCEAPVPEDVKVKGNILTITFNGDVTPTTAAVTGFIIGDGKGTFYPASARQIDSRTIELRSSRIDHPACARYNWADYPCGNLYGAGRLPVAPFATDMK